MDDNPPQLRPDSICPIVITRCLSDTLAIKMKFVRTLGLYDFNVSAGIERIVIPEKT